ncbi:Rrf2 family transcriptional regulator [bacterium]|nr:MAG: Rrf2 family transcriptional regulator [bacterium]
MFSKTTEYALRAMAHCGEAQRAGKGTQTAEVIAERTGVPVAYLGKVMQALRRAGLLQSQRGAGGGVRLSRSADEILVFDIVQAVDPIERILACPLGLEAHKHRLCPLHAKMDAALAMVEESFKNTTLAQVLESGGTFGPPTEVAGSN